MNSPTTSPLAEAVAQHGRDLAALHRIVGQALRETSDTFIGAWNRSPSGTARSATMRARSLELAADEPFLEISVTGEGEDWVRVFLPSLGKKIPLRTRPKSVVVQDDGGALFDLDLFGGTGELVMFWEPTDDGTGLARLSIAEVLTPSDHWGFKCVVRAEVFITENLIPISSGAPVGTGNYDDDLQGVVGRWPSDVPESEEEVTEREALNKHDGNGTDSAMGADGV
jgi:hypothetical protein